MENNGLSQGERFFQEIRTATFRKEEYQYIHTGIIGVYCGVIWFDAALPHPGNPPARVSPGPFLRFLG